MAIKNTNYYCVILAGGKGKRLWPCSRDAKPKQFLDFFGVGRTQLQQTYDRFVKIVPKENIFINTTKQYLHYVVEQLPEVDGNHIMAEPVHRNTAPSVAWAAHCIDRINPHACIIVTPSDQTIVRDDVFRDNIIEGLEFVEQNDRLLTMGVKPTRPEPGYGYIQVGEHSGVDDIFKVKAFTEKPDREFANMFVESGEWYWNTGLFLSNVRYLRKCMGTFMPAILRNLDNLRPDWTIEEENLYVDEHFPSFPNLSIDYGILEKSDNVYVMKCDFGWADLGTWHGIYEATSKTEGDNVLVDTQAIFDDSHNNIVKLPKGRLAVINGLDGFIVAEEGNVLFICKKGDSSSLVRKYVNEIQLKLGDDYA